MLWYLYTCKRLFSYRNYCVVNIKLKMRVAWSFCDIKRSFLCSHGWLKTLYGYLTVSKIHWITHIYPFSVTQCNLRTERHCTEKFYDTLCICIEIEYPGCTYAPGFENKDFGLILFWYWQTYLLPCKCSHNEWISYTYIYIYTYIEWWKMWLAHGPDFDIALLVALMHMPN